VSPTAEVEDDSSIKLVNILTLGLGIKPRGPNILAT